MHPVSTVMAEVNPIYPVLEQTLKRPFQKLTKKGFLRRIKLHVKIPSVGHFWRRNQIILPKMTFEHSQASTVMVEVNPVYAVWKQTKYLSKAFLAAF